MYKYLPLQSYPTKEIHGAICLHTGCQQSVCQDVCHPQQHKAAIIASEHPFPTDNAVYYCHKSNRQQPRLHQQGARQGRIDKQPCVYRTEYARKQEKNFDNHPISPGYRLRCDPRLLYSLAATQKKAPRNLQCISLSRNTPFHLMYGYIPQRTSPRYPYLPD